MKNKYVIILIVVIGVSAFLRFYNLKDRGVFEYDEGYYLLQGQFVYSSVMNIVPILKDIKASFIILMA